MKLRLRASARHPALVPTTEMHCMDRREFMAAGLAAGAGIAPFGRSLAGASQPAGPSAGRFRLRYAPHPGMFRQHAGEDPLDQIRFMADAGFRAFEDHGLMAKPAALVDAIGAELARHNMTMGLFVAAANYGDPTFASGRRDLQCRVLAELRQAVDVAKRTGARSCTIVPGKLDRHLSPQKQTANAIELLKQCVDVVEPSGMTLLLEPLNHGTRQPQLFLHDLEQAAMLCRAVDSPRCRLLFDVYHLRVAGRDPLRSLVSVWDQVGYIQVGDYPGRKEPGTGTIDYRRLFSTLDAGGYRGLIGMEHGSLSPGKMGEQNVIAAYQAHDPR